MLLVALIFTAVAAVVDAREHRIPNWVSGGLLLVAGALTLAGYHPLGWGAAVTGFSIAFGLSVGGYIAGALGAGDVKLLAAIGLSLGHLPFLVFVASTSLFGGAMALFVRRRSQAEIAYAPAMLLGLLSLVPIALAN